MGLVFHLIFLSLVGVSFAQDANHSVSPDRRSFKKSTGENVTLEIGEKTCESLEADGKYVAEQIKDKPAIKKSNEESIQITIECKDKKRVQMITKDSSGEMVENWKNDQREGVLKKTSSKGILLYEARFINGVKEGEEKTFFENGTISTLRRYKDGKLDGEQVDYDNFGKPVLKFTPRALRSPRNKVPIVK